MCISRRFNAVLPEKDAFQAANPYGEPPKLSGLFEERLKASFADYLGAESGNSGWSYAISADRVRNALNSWTVESIADDYYRFNNIDLPDLKLILDAFGINIPQKLFRKQSLRSLKSSFDFSTQYI